VKSGNVAGLLFGFSQALEFLMNAALFYAGAEFVQNYGESGEDVFISIFVIMFGSFGAGQAQAYGPQLGKAMASAVKIFGIIDDPSKIDATIDDESKKDPRVEFEGQIEFKDVWFRYPERKDEWVLKGLNLKIAPKENVAIVGESGAGKSTIVQLLYRFYDPQFGQILIDGIDIKEFDIKSLRRTLGLVQQEPVLFDMSIAENIAYASPGKINASEIVKSTEIANAMEFIKEMEGDTDIEDVKNVIEMDTPLVSGFYKQCGLKGSKLSGGQK
jgi:ATP-binding cassette subfamily B (MDR/TAP) protein 1